MKRIFVHLCIFFVACCVFGCNADTSMTADAKSDTKAAAGQDEWQQTINKASDAVKADFIAAYNDMGHSYYEKALDLKADEMSVYGIPVFTIDSALWVDRQDLPLDSYLKLDTQRAGFYILLRGDFVSKTFAAYKDETWDLQSFLWGVSAAEASSVSKSINAGEKVISICVNPKAGNNYTFVYAFRDNSWIRIDNGFKYTDDAMEDLRTRWTAQITR